MLQPPPVSLSLAGLSTDLGAPQGGARAWLGWAAGLGYRGVQLDGAAQGIRSRELDRSARRDMSSLMRRLQLGFSGLDLWIPAAHFANPAFVDRAVSATTQAIELAQDLQSLGGASGAVVSIEVDSKADQGVYTAIARAAERAGIRVADHTWPPAASVLAMPEGSPVGVGVDPAAVLLTGAEAAREVSRLATGPVSARISDLSATGRVVAGTGKLNLMEYEVALATRGFKGFRVVDLRGVRGQAEAARETLVAMGGESRTP